MKEPITGYLLKCDACGEYMEFSDGGSAVFVDDNDDIVNSCHSMEWEIDGERHYCDNCKNERQ